MAEHCLGHHCRGSCVIADVATSHTPNITRVASATAAGAVENLPTLDALNFAALPHAAAQLMALSNSSRPSNARSMSSIERAVVSARLSALASIERRRQRRRAACVEATDSRARVGAIDARRDAVVDRRRSHALDRRAVRTDLRVRGACANVPRQR
jgi:hypothetical protein